MRLKVVAIVTLRVFIKHERSSKKSCVHEKNKRDHNIHDSENKFIER